MTGSPDSSAEIEAKLKFFLFEEYYRPHRPFHTYLPFHYHKIPAYYRQLFYKQMLKPKRLKIRKRGSCLWTIEKSVESWRKKSSKFPIAPWPYGKKSALALTHDIDTHQGLKNVREIANIEALQGLSSAWNFVVKHYPLDYALLDWLIEQGHEIGCHGHNHDGKLAFLKESQIRERFLKCKDFLEKYKVRGFRSPSLLRTERLYKILPEFFSYDSSVPDTDPIEQGGCCSVFPFMRDGLVILPLSVPQDCTLLSLGYSYPEMYSIWMEKINWIREIGGLILVNTHPDPHFSGNPGMMRLYKKMLKEVTSDSSIWRTLPYKIAEWWQKGLNT